MRLLAALSDTLNPHQAAFRPHSVLPCPPTQAQVINLLCNVIGKPSALQGRRCVISQLTAAVPAAVPAAAAAPLPWAQAPTRRQAH